MDAQLKQRVVGAAVLVALGVIFIPLMLDNGSDPGPAVDLDIGSPAPTDFSSRVVPIDDATMERVERAMDARPETLTDPAPAGDGLPDAMITEAESEPVTDVAPDVAPEAAQEPVAQSPQKPSSAGEPVRAPAGSNVAETATPPRTGVDAWVVQLGSFTTQANADGLVERLKKSGYTAFIEPSDDGGKTTYRVRVGPELTKLTAKRIRDDIAKDVELKGIIMRYP